MKNIFENAYFGKIYKTRDNRKALYINCSKKSNIHHLVVENDFMSERAYWEDGHNDFDRNNRKEDIVSEWQEPIVCKCKWKDYYDYRIMMPSGEAHVRVSFFKDETIISDLFVDEKYRNKGYATILLNKVDELLNGKQAIIYPLEPWQKLWYEKRGYIIGTNDDELDEISEQ